MYIKPDGSEHPKPEKKEKTKKMTKIIGINIPKSFEEKIVKAKDLVSKPKPKKKQSRDKKLWEAFSLFIRLRDANNEGICRCITCGLPRHFRQMDCGHGIGRQHWGTKYDEKNNHAQCKKCNGFEEGRKDLYKIEVDKKYGKGTWDMLDLKSKQFRKAPSQFEIDMLEVHYTELYNKIAKEKGIKL